jgi:hypothetical protein
VAAANRAANRIGQRYTLKTSVCVLTFLGTTETIKCHLFVDFTTSRSNSSAKSTLIRSSNRHTHHGLSLLLHVVLSFRVSLGRPHFRADYHIMATLYICLSFFTHLCFLGWIHLHASGQTAHWLILRHLISNSYLVDARWTVLHTSPSTEICATSGHTRHLSKH